MQLRTYQTDSIDALRAGFRAAHVRQVLAAPTGSGKSIVMLAMIDAAMQKGSKILFVCERRVLVDQFSRHLDSAGIDHGIMMAKTWRFRPQAQIQVASAQTLEKMETWPEFDIVFLDELHMCMRKSIISLIKNRPKLRMVGATATPFHPAISEHFSNVANVVTMRELIDDGFLVPFRVFVAHEIDTKGVKVTGGEWQKDELEERGRKIVGDVVTDYIKLSGDVFGGPRKTICFSSGVAHGTDLVQKFQEAGVNAVQISYRDTDDFKAEVLADFAKPDTAIKIVISSDILTRGFDQPDVEHIILARPLRKSFSTHVQMVGRGARPSDGKSFCVLQDHSGNWLRFMDDWETLYHDGASLLADADAKARKEMTESEKKDALCPKCGAVFPSKSDTCLHCGYVRVRQSMVEAVPGQIFELTSGRKVEKYDSAYKEAWYQGMVALLRQRGQKDGRAFFLYKEKFHVEPAWKKVAGVITPDVIGYLQRANIAFAKRQRSA